jgi:hypothetical protein
MKSGGWLALLLLGTLYLCGCAGDRRPAGALPGAAAAAPSAGLPAPTALAPLLPAQRDASLVPGDLIKGGEGYASSLPHQRVTATAGGAVFDPDFTGTAAPFAGLSFAIYFFDISGYDGVPAVQYTWNGPPPAAADAWVALVNWDTQLWDFFPVEADRRLDVPGGLAPYIDFGGALLAAVIVTGSISCELDRIYIGSLPPTAVLSAAPSTGFAPLHVEFDASGSNDPDGTIVDYAWDPEGDGSFDTSTGLSPLFSFDYPAPGIYAPAVRVTDADGLTGSGTTAVSTFEESYFTLGKGMSTEAAQVAAVLSDGHLLLFGSHTETAPIPQVVRMSPGGAVSMAVDFREDFCEWSDAQAGSDGHVYAVGAGYSTTASAYGCLLQKWTPSGELLWSRIYSTGSEYESFSAVYPFGSSVFAIGTINPGFDKYGLLVSFDLDGNVQWARLFGSPDHDTQYRAFIGVDIGADIGSDTIQVCGTYEAPGIVGDVVAVNYSHGGVLRASRSWGDPAYYENPMAGMLIGNFIKKAYVAGSRWIPPGSGDTSAFFTRVAGAAVEYSLPNADLGAHLLEYGPSNGMTLLVNRDEDTWILGQVDETTLGFSGGQLLGSCWFNDMVRYDNSSILLLGQTTESTMSKFPNFDPIVDPLAVGWVDIPSLDAPAVLSAEDVVFETSPVTGLEHNRTPLTGQDLLVAVEQL